MPDLTPLQHFEHIRETWLEFLTSTRLYLRNLDGDTSRAIGRIVYDLVESKKEDDWPSVGTAQFMKNDTFLWHELADSRKP
jgi:hypothetical protein